MNLIEVQVEGKNKELWSDLKTKLLKAINKSLDTVINFENNNTIRDEAKEFSTALLKYAKARLAKPDIDNQQTLAQIELAFSQKAKTLAEARIMNAQAQAIEFSNAINQLKLALGAAKALMLTSEDSSDILFLKQIECFQSYISEFNRLEK